MTVERCRIEVESYNQRKQMKRHAMTSSGFHGIRNQLAARYRPNLFCSIVCVSIVMSRLVGNNRGAYILWLPFRIFVLSYRKKTRILHTGRFQTSGVLYCRILLLLKSAPPLKQRSQRVAVFSQRPLIAQTQAFDTFTAYYI